MAFNLGLQLFWDMDLSELDEYGYDRAREYNNGEYMSFMPNYYEMVDIKSEKWVSLLIGPNPFQKCRKLKEYIRQGIPYQFRGPVWLAVSGAEDLQSTMPNNFYDSVLSQEHDGDVAATIAVETHSAFPNNVFFQASPRIQIDVFDVLIAYANHNPTLGYCQGFNCIAGLLVFATRSQEKSFWLLKVLVENILKDYYSSTMEGVLVDIQVLSELVRMKLPDVHQHLSGLDLEWAAVTKNWFACLYADLFPNETVYRIWDCLFYEGSKIIFRVAITLIKKYRTELLACEDLTQAVECFRNMTKNQNCAEFMESIFEEPGKLSKSTIEKLRKKVREENDRKKKEAEEKK